MSSLRPFVARSLRVVVSMLACAAILPVAEAIDGTASLATSPRDLLTAEAEGLVAVRYVPQDSRSAQIIVKNAGDAPLTLRMPRAFVGVPVLAQFGGGMGGMGGGMGGMGGMGMGGGGFCWVAREVYGAHDPRWVEFRDWLASDAPAWLHDLYRDHGEGFAGWIRDRPVAKWMMRHAMDRAIAGRDLGQVAAGHLQVRGGHGQALEPGVFLVHPGQTRKFRFSTVCLEHGKAEPSPRIPYRMLALDTVSADPRLAVIMAALGSGTVSQKAAQAAAWHVANGLSWQRLSAETIRHVGGIPDEPFFQPAELAVAMQLVKHAEQVAAAAEPAAVPSAATGR